MIKVLKRDGSVEPFQIEKINNWWMWATKQHNIPVGEGIEAVQRAVRALSQETTSEKIQRSLITELIALKRWSTVMMAGTLEASLIHKSVFGNNIPSVKTHFTNLLKEGYVVEFPLSDDEWEILEETIDHKRDFNMPQFALRYIMDSYALGNVVTGERVETPQFTYLRMAIAVGSSYLAPQRIDVIKETYELLSTKVISAPTPNFTHLGTKNNGLASCFPAGSKVLTSSGIKHIEDICVGDLVITHNNQLKPVYHTQSKSYTGKLTLLNSTATFLNELSPTEDHRIYGIKNRTSSEIQKDNSLAHREWIKADNLRVGDYVKLGYESLVDTSELYLWDVIQNSSILGKKYVLEDTAIKRTIKYVEGDKRRYPDIVNFNIRQKDIFRLLGYYLAEGCICTPTVGSQHLIFTFNIKEIEYIQDVKTILAQFGGRVSISENLNDNSTKVTCYSKPLVALMYELAGTGFNKKLLSPSIMHSEQSLQEELLCGLIRGDGCAVVSGYVVTLYNVNLIRQIRDIGLRCKLHLAISKSKKLEKGATEPDATIRFSVDGASAFALNVGKNLEKIRKNKHFNGANILFLSDGAYARVRMLSSKYVTCEVYDLSVTDDASFTVSGVAVHNCCLYAAGDDRKSLAAANLVTYVMTYSSAGLGYHQNVRAVGDPVRGGKISHQGEIFYLKSNAANAAANRQSKRGGAINAFVPAYSKEIDFILAGREPTASPGKALNGIDISLVLTKDFIRRAVKSEPAITFSEYSHPEMFKSMYTGNPADLEALMTDAVKDEANASRLINPRNTMANLGRVTVSTGRNFAFFVDNANYHTPFKDPLTGSNLCMEIINPVKPYKEISDLWRTDDQVEGEVSMCNLGAVNHDLVADNPELHKRACLALLRMIDYCIHYGYYELSHIGYTAKQRMNAAVGVMNTATYMARKHLRFDSDEGLKSVSQFAERHMYFLIESSLTLGKEKGNAPWIHKTKWAGYTNSEGEYVSAWMPIDTQNKRLAKELGLEPSMDWEDLRSRVAANKGIRNSILGAIMPGESSSKALGAANSIYPVRDLGLSKTDSTTAIDWCAVGAGEDEYEYQLAFTMTTKATTRYYAGWQMWLDGGISADYWLPFEMGQNVIEIDDILQKYAEMYAYGLKSHYYTVPKTQKSNADKKADMDKLFTQSVNPTNEPSLFPIHDVQTNQNVQLEIDEDDDRVYGGEAGCAGGACSI
jgi:ribonucleotide reductase alpha subunit